MVWGWQQFDALRHESPSRPLVFFIYPIKIIALKTEGPTWMTEKKKGGGLGQVISYLSLDHLILISDGSHKQIKSISYPPHRHLRGSSSCCSLVVQLLFSCCPVIDWTTTEEEEDMNRTRTGGKVGMNWNKIWEELKGNMRRIWEGIEERAIKIRGNTRNHLQNSVLRFGRKP